MIWTLFVVPISNDNRYYTTTITIKISSLHFYVITWTKCNSKSIPKSNINQLKGFYHTLVLTRLQLRRILVLFYQRSDFRMVINRSIAIYAFMRTAQVCRILFIKMNPGNSGRQKASCKVTCLPFLQTIHVRRAKHAGHSCYCNLRFPMDSFKWTYQFCADCRCRLIDLLKAMSERDGWREGERDSKGSVLLTRF